MSDERRILSDIQSKLGSLDYRILKMAAGPRDTAPPGSALVRTVAAQIARHYLQDRQADAFEKAATSPAQTTVSGWAQELATAAVPNFILSLVRHSAFAGILAKSPQVSLLGTGSEKVPVSGAAPPARIITEGAPIPV